VAHDERVFGVTGTEAIMDVAAGSRGLLAVGRDGSNAVVWSSADGAEWRRLSDLQHLFAREESIWALTITDSHALGVGYHNSPGGGDEYAVTWISPDGSSWSRAPIEEASVTLLRGVVATDRGLIAVGSQNVAGQFDAAVWTSPDGAKWAQVRADDSVFGGDGNQLAYDVAARGGTLVAVGADYGAPQPAVWTTTE
jgi:hypothetical protein